MRTIGTVVRGVRAPIIREGDNIAEVTAASVMEAWKEAGITPYDRDVVAVTESVVARAQGNYVTVQQIAQDVRAKTGGETVGVCFPILSRNRFSLLLRGIAAGCKKVVLLLSYPSDEVGNPLIDWDLLDKAGINPYSDVLTLERFRELFGRVEHPFTGVDYIDFYTELMTGEREVFKGGAVAAGDDLKDVVLVATPEVMYDERLRNLDDFINEAGKIARAYRLHKGDIFSVTKPALDGVSSPSVGDVVELKAGTKLNVAASATANSTQVGKIIAIDVVGRYTYYVILVG